MNTKSAILAAAIGLLSTLANAQRVGITPESLLTFDDVTMPGKDFRVLRTTYAPGGMNGKHYHPSHVVFYVLEGAGIWQEDGNEPVTRKPGGVLHVSPGVIHAQRHASATEKL